MYLPPCFVYTHALRTLILGGYTPSVKCLMHITVYSEMELVYFGTLGSKCEGRLEW